MQNEKKPINLEELLEGIDLLWRMRIIYEYWNTIW